MTPLTFPEILLRVGLAFVAGFIIGFERSGRGRPAGLRTTILTCVVASIGMIVSEELFVESGAMVASGNWRPDPARLGAGVLTGIGFLGAGTIMRHDNVIRGVTTAACLWFVTVIGLAFGSGEYAVGGIGFAIGLITLFILPRLEMHIQAERYATLTVIESLEGIGEDELRKHVEAMGAHTKTLKLSYDLEKKQKKIVLELRLKKPLVYDTCRKLIAEVGKSRGVLQVSWE
jgi:putative Mg2+ transporter-C (MgtC) family protein